MKIIINFVIIITGLVTVSCNQHSNHVKELQVRIDSLQKELTETYKPGFGEFMSGIQVHHAKLWFAGINQNWELADFEVHEIQEALDDVIKFCTDRPEVKEIGMMNASLESISKAIQQKSSKTFKNNFVLLTNTCNKCHKTTDHGFNVVTIPTALPVVNQEFKPVQ